MCVYVCVYDYVYDYVFSTYLHIEYRECADDNADDEGLSVDVDAHSEVIHRKTSQKVKLKNVNENC